MEVDETFEGDSVPKEPIYKCYICTIDFKSKDAFMKHRKENHTSGVQRCSDDCSRSDDECWFLHIPDKMNPLPQKEQVFRKVSGNQFPPEQMSMLLDMIKSLCTKVDTMEKRMDGSK